MLLDEENLYIALMWLKPRSNTTKDNNNCFFTRNNQYIKNKMFSIISKGTPRLNTDNIEKLFGGT
tara:strand:+ start:63366 stop:63560 length:195 start_codon:yes stop_codon:yes gene_type:complete